MARNLIKKTVLGLFLSISLIFFISPLVYLFFEAFKTKADLFDWSKFFIFQPTLDNFVKLIEEYRIGAAITNSLIISLSSVAICILLSTLASYGISRYKFKGRESIALDILTMRMFPQVVVAIPIFIIAHALGLWGTYYIMILVYATFNLPLGIWLMKTFIDDIPLDLEEAAMIDGWGRVGILRNVVFPLIIPGVIATTFLLFVFTWNEFLFANILTKGETHTVTVIAAMTNKTRHSLYTWADSAACGVVVLVPLIVIFFIIERYVMRALTFGIVK